jgi:GMP synthase-like glutamine amidotransferase
MQVHVFQHVAFEDLGSMRENIFDLGHSISTTHWHRGEIPPTLSSIDSLIVMGGPMGIYDEKEHPWLAAEKKYIRQAIAANKTILGICLGAQLIADCLGAKVTRNTHKEIGWHRLKIDESVCNHPLAKLLSECGHVFHWHGDTFNLPENALPIASSEACQHQGFIYNNHVFAFQFHLETTEESAQKLISNCSSDLDDSKYVQSPEKIMENNIYFSNINYTMKKIIGFILSP